MEKQSYQTLSLDHKDSVVTLYFDRPEKRNAMSPQMFYELGLAANYLSGLDSVRAVIITGRGTAFSAGLDLSAFKDFSNIKSREFRSFVKMGQRNFRAFEIMEKPVIAMVNGPALGAGMEIALACDLIYASTEASFGLLEVRFGLIPDLGATQRLPCMIGIHRAKELIFSGDTISAEDADRMGLVNRLLPPDLLEKETFDTAHRLAEMASDVIGLSKTAINHSRDGSIETGLEIEAQAQTICFQELINNIRVNGSDKE